jgi:hypothetical protein
MVYRVRVLYWHVEALGTRPAELVESFDGRVVVWALAADEPEYNHCGCIEVALRF